MKRSFFDCDTFLNRHAGLDPASSLTHLKVNSGYRIKSGMTIARGFGIVIIVAEYAYSGWLR
ncbi:hypothetical protein [Undibacterium sp.]|uniref:hypothetical protein n=1 Tax=Undibacterium sp. TaxID=1914977 RepID=UPI0025CE1B65|nr:hypothetical protein [Undibacterium sp.]